MPDPIKDNLDLAERCESLAQAIKQFAGYTPPVHEKERVTDAVEKLHEALRAYAWSNFHSDKGLGYRESRWSMHHEMRSTVDGLQEHFDGFDYSKALQDAVEVKRERDELLNKLEEVLNNHE